MALLKKILFALIALILLLVVGGFLLPSQAHVERSVNMTAPACTVQAQIDNFSRFNAWSPWADIDPDTEYSFEGPGSGVGAKMSWVSEHKNVGTGSQEITHVEPGLVKSKLDFGPQGQADASFKLAEAGEETEVTWGFDTDFGFNLIGRYMGLMMDSFVGKDFEKGLGRLKTLVEELPDTNWCDLEIEVVEMQPITYACAAGSASQNPEEISAALGVAYGEVMAFLGQRRLSQAGPPLSVTNRWDETGYGFEAGIPVNLATEIVPPADSVVQIGRTPAGPAARAIYRGSYDGLSEAGQKLEAYLVVHGLEAAGRSWDVFVSDPGSTPPEELETHLYVPVGEAG